MLEKYVSVCMCVYVHGPQDKAPNGLKTTNNLPDPLIIFSDSISYWSDPGGEAVQFGKICKNDLTD